MALISSKTLQIRRVMQREIGPDGNTDTEYAAIVAYLEPLKDLFPAWQLIK